MVRANLPTLPLEAPLFLVSGSILTLLIAVYLLSIESNAIARSLPLDVMPNFRVSAPLVPIQLLPCDLFCIGCTYIEMTCTQFKGGPIEADKSETSKNFFLKRLLEWSE